MEKIGIDETTPNPLGGVIGRDENTGLLQEQSALSLNELISDFSVINYYRIFQRAYRCSGDSYRSITVALEYG